MEEDLNDWGAKSHNKLKKSLTWDACTWDNGLSHIFKSVREEPGTNNEMNLPPPLVGFLETDFNEENKSEGAQKLNDVFSPTSAANHERMLASFLNQDDFGPEITETYTETSFVSELTPKVDSPNKFQRPPDTKKHSKSLRRVNSAELVRKAFPEMLFDRTAAQTSAIDNNLEFVEEGENESDESEEEDVVSLHTTHMPSHPLQRPASYHSMTPTAAMYEPQHSPYMGQGGYDAQAQYPYMYHMQQPMFPPGSMQQGHMPVQNMHSQQMFPNNMQGPYVNASNAPPQDWNNPGQAAGTCSNLLAWHKRTGRRPPVHQLAGHVVEFSKDPHGSRYLQEITAAATPEEKEMMVNEVLEDCLNVIQDLFGNYVMQNFLDHATDAQRDVIAAKMVGVVTTLSMHAHGCRVVQRVLDFVGPEMRFRLLDELVLNPENLERAAQDPHATHVLQKAVTVLQRDLYPHIEKRQGRAMMQNPAKKKSQSRQKDKQYVPSSDPQVLETSRVLLKAIENVVAENVMVLATNQHACRLVQRVLGDCDPERSPCVSVMIGALEADYENLSVDQHGNFIMQHILDMGQQDQADRVFQFVSTRVIDLSQHKFGSHLVEKCIVTATPDQAQGMIDDLLSANYNTLTKMMKDPYANFVLQRAYDVANDELRQKFEFEVSRRNDVLSQFTHGRHIISHLAKRKQR